MRIQDENGMLHEAREITISMSDPVLNEETIDKVRFLASCRAVPSGVRRQHPPRHIPRLIPPQQVGNYSIVYSVKAPWTNTPDVAVQRDIEVMDLNECALEPGHPKWEKVSQSWYATEDGACAWASRGDRP